MSIVGVKNRLFIFLDWMWNYFTYDQSLRLLIKPKRNQKMKSKVRELGARE
jgi:NADH:ubiquinone reductase (H+-translocating)